MDETQLYSELGSAIASRRRTLELTQAHVAARVGISRASLANIEVGRQKVLVHHLYKLASVLRLSSPASLLPLPSSDESAERVPLPRGGFTSRQRSQIEQFYKSVGSSHAPKRTE